MVGSKSGPADPPVEGFKVASSHPPSSRRPSAAPASQRYGSPVLRRSGSDRSPPLSSSSWRFERLASVDFSLAEAARRIVEGSLGVVPGERVMLVLDRERVELGRALMDAVRERAARCDLIVLEEIGQRPLLRLPAPVAALLGQVQASVFLAGFEGEERAMRAELVASIPRFGVRHAHMVGVTRKSFCAGFSAELTRIADVARRIRSRVRTESVLRVRSAAGTDLTVRCHAAHRWSELSGVIRPGKWENLPSGEIFTAPGDVSGAFVCDASMSESFGERSGFLARTPVRFGIDAGYVRSVSCPDAGLEREVQRWLASGHHLDRVGIMILGTNIGMRDPVGEILCDQNLPGLHLGLGATFPERTGASWNTQGQLTLAAGYTDVDLDGSPLIRSGRYLDLR